MPTGYTVDIKKGITFEQFAMNCARAFDACVTMRDDPMDKPIPESFEPSSWHKERLDELSQELIQINRMSIGEAEEQASESFERETKKQEKAIVEDRKLMEQYNDMLRQVKQWTPPTEEHIEFKNFMIKQIEGSIESDGMVDFYVKHPPKRVMGEEWLLEKKNRIQKDINYHEVEDQKEKDRTESRNRWVKALRSSLIQ